LLLGFLLATASLVGSTKTPTLLALVVPMVALALPLFETSFSFLRRLLRGQHPFKPDRRHLHHRLLDLGLNHRRVVVLLLFFTAFLGINSVALAQSGSEWVLFNALFLIGGIVLLIENLKFLERRREKS
jgi:UDP-GlcNAc:undecaprenyl-phosphate GlcNAc-1-phosphate transferase